MIYQIQNLFQQLDTTFAIHQTTGILVFGQTRTIYTLRISSSYYALSDIYSI